jgi:hypothetical protein
MKIVDKAKIKYEKEGKDYPTFGSIVRRSDGSNRKAQSKIQVKSTRICHLSQEQGEGINYKRCEIIRCESTVTYSTIC